MNDVEPQSSPLFGDSDDYGRCYSDDSPQVIPPTPRHRSELTESLAVRRRLTFSNSGLPSSSVRDGRPRSFELNSATRRASDTSTVHTNTGTSSPSTSSDILRQILKEVQKTNKEVDVVKASLSDLDKRMAAVEQKETEISSTSASSSSERQKTSVPTKVRVSTLCDMFNYT